jgi:hypothetical protein
MLGREVVEGEQRLAVLDQAGDGLVVFRLVLGQKAIERGLGVGPALGLVDGVEVGLGFLVSRFG